MGFGYIPQKSLWKNIILKILGYPNTIRRIQAPILMRMLNPQKNDFIVDAGCGGGYFSYEIAKISKCVGVDRNIRNNEKYIMKYLKSISFVETDIQNMPFKDETVDKILLSSVLQMVDNDILLLKECNRVLKKNAIFVLSVPVEYVYYKELNKIKRKLKEKFGSQGKGFYKYNEIIKLLKDSGFNIIKMEYSPKSWGSFIYETWLYFCSNFNLPLYSSLYFFLYPVAYFDRFCSKEKKGCEIIIKAKKIWLQKQMF